MAKCDHCGSHVSEGFARVFRDSQDRLAACPTCAANIGIEQAARRRNSKSGTS